MNSFKRLVQFFKRAGKDVTRETTKKLASTPDIGQLPRFSDFWKHQMMEWRTQGSGWKHLFTIFPARQSRSENNSLLKIYQDIVKETKRRQELRRRHKNLEANEPSDKTDEEDQSDPEKASVAFMITKNMEKELRTLGYRAETINKLSPKEALYILENKIKFEPKLPNKKANQSKSDNVIILGSTPHKDQGQNDDNKNNNNNSNDISVKKSFSKDSMEL